MSEPLYQQLVHDLDHIGAELTGGGHDVAAWLTRHIHPHPYHDNHDQVWSPTKGTTAVSLLDNAIAMVDDLGAHLKNLAENDVPALEAVQSSKIVQAIEGFVLTPEAEQFIADTVSYLASKYAQPAADTTGADTTGASPAAA